MQRRRFLASLAALSAAGACGRLYAAPPAAPRLLVVFLRGGYDCTNTLIPYASDFYYEARPHIAVARPDSANATGALRLDGDWALAPALRGSLGPMYTARQCAFVPFTGTEDLSRSHFETQDDIERGLPPGGRGFDSGFLGRLAAVLRGRAAPIAFTENLPLCLRGGGDVPNLALRTFGAPAFDEREAALLVGMYQGSRLAAAAREGLELRRDVAQEFAAEMAQANRGAIDARGFVRHAQGLAELMRERYRIGFIDVGGWDTHVNQGGAEGALANRLDDLGQGLAEFAAALGAEWNHTVVVVLSEFGRTFRENGNQGTDHGHGTAYWVLGGGVRGGRIAGAQVPVTAATLLQNRDYPVLNNYRAVLGGLFARLWELDAARLERVFPQTRPLDLSLV